MRLTIFSLSPSIGCSFNINHCIDWSSGVDARLLGQTCTINLLWLVDHIAHVAHKPIYCVQCALLCQITWIKTLPLWVDTTTIITLLSTIMLWSDLTPLSQYFLLCLQVEINDPWQTLCNVKCFIKHLALYLDLAARSTSVPVLIT